MNNKRKLSREKNEERKSRTEVIRRNKVSDKMKIVRKNI